MTREEVYEKCVEKRYASMEDYGKGWATCRDILPQEAIDAIIDCAVEEAIRAVKEVSRNDRTIKTNTQTLSTYPFV